MHLVLTVRRWQFVCHCCGFQHSVWSLVLALAITLPKLRWCPGHQNSISLSMISRCCTYNIIENVIFHDPWMLCLLYNFLHPLYYIVEDVTRWELTIGTKALTIAIIDYIHTSISHNYSNVYGPTSMDCYNIMCAVYVCISVSNVIFNWQHWFSSSEEWLKRSWLVKLVNLYR